MKYAKQILVLTDHISHLNKKASDLIQLKTTANLPHEEIVTLDLLCNEILEEGENTIAAIQLLKGW